MLSPQEWNLICVYHSGSREATAIEIREVLPCMEPDVRAVAEYAIGKLYYMSAGEYDALISGEAAL